jgi:hypothetical protein
MPSKSAFAKWLEADPQKVANWRSRDSLPRDGALLIQAKTGASLDWLLAGKGDPFPQGPITYAEPTDDLAQRLREAEDRLAGAFAVMHVLVEALSAKLPGAAAELVQGLRRRVPDRAGKVELEALAAAAEEYLPASGVPRAAGRQAGGSRPHKGR